jgi:inner membrane protein
VAPDSDIVTRIFGDSHTYLEHHRGASHSAPGLLALSAACAGLVAALTPGVNWLQLFPWTLAGALSHVTLDLMNPYGTKVAWPFSRKRFAFDILMIVDLPILGALAAALGLNRARPGAGPVIFGLALAFIAVYILFRAGIHRRLLAFARRELAHLSPVRLDLFPGIVGVNRWAFVGETPDGYVLGTVTWRPLRLEVQERRAKSWNRIIEASTRSRAARIFIDFARYPYAEATPREGGYTVRWIDLRYRYRGSDQFSTTVDLDDQLRVMLR